MIIHLNLHASQLFPIKLFGEPKNNQPIKIKVTNGTSPVIVKSLSHDSFSCEQQDEQGHTYLADQYVTFQLNIENIQTLFAHVEIYVVDECIGATFVTQSYFAKAFGNFLLPLLNPSTGKLSAEIKFDYLLIHRWRDQKLTDMPCTTLSSSKEEFLYMGHRGSGTTTDRTSIVLENTLPSFFAALSEGASFVELDVLLTKDEIPIVFHDYDANVWLEKIDGAPGNLRVRVQDLTLDDLKTCKMDFARAAAGGENYKTDVYKTLFPTLQEVLNDTPSSLGLFIEVKYPSQTRASKAWETEGYFDQNLVIDKILDVVMNHPGDRPIMFCSFDPEICTLLQCKQHRYPVVFITCGENSEWEENMDIRCRTRGFALNFSLMNDLLGVSFYGDPLLQDCEEFSCIVSTLKTYHKHVFTWGPCNDSKNNVEYQKSLRVTGIISDHLENLSSDN